MAFVWITKYRKPVLKGDIAIKLRDLIKEIGASEDVQILKGPVRLDHVPVLLSLPPNVSPSRIMQAIKGKTSHHWTIHKELRGRPLRARGISQVRQGTSQIGLYDIGMREQEPAETARALAAFRRSIKAIAFGR